MSCNSNKNCGQIVDCGCLHDVPSKCVFVSNNYDCLDITKGDTLDDVLSSLNNIICDLPTPSGTSYVGTPGQINISGNTISLSNTILTQISNIESDIDVLEDCCDNSVKTITTLTPTYLNITQPTPGNYRINYLPSSLPIVDKSGIIDNFVDWQVLNNGFTYSKNLSTYQLKAGDLLIIKGAIRKQFNDVTNNSITISDGVTSQNVSPLDFAPFEDLNLFIDFEIKLPIKSVISNTSFTTRIYTRTELLCAGVGQTEQFTDNRKVSVKTTQLQPDFTFNQSNFRLIFNNSNPEVLESLTVEILRKI